MSQSVAMPSQSPSRRPLSGLPALTLLLALGAPAALSQPVGPNPEGPRLTPEQRQKVFPEQRRLALQDHSARIAILQRGQSCLEAAKNAETLRNCMRTEREAMRQQRRQHMGSLRALFERNGLPAPPWLQRQGGPGGQGGGWGSGEI
jgi:hypothetical protein